MQRNGFHTSKQIQPCYITVRMQLQKQYKIIWTENKCERSCKLKRTVASDKSGGHVTRHVRPYFKDIGHPCALERFSTGIQKMRVCQNRQFYFDILCLYQIALILPSSTEGFPYQRAERRTYKRSHDEEPKLF